MIAEELKVLQALKHPNIIYLHEIIDDPDKINEDIYLVTEYHSNGSIGDQLKNINK
jgi:serine/threonine protein kinase